MPPYSNHSEVLRISQAVAAEASFANIFNSSWFETVDYTVIVSDENEILSLSDPTLVLKAIGLGLMIILTICGNLLVIAAVVPSPNLRTPTHSLIVNLAVADLLLGMAVLPLSATRELAGGIWLLGPDLCSIWTTLDVLCCTASILSLCGISVDRYVGVSKPLGYSRIITKRRVYLLITGIWALALAISIAPPLGWKDDSAQNSSNVDDCQVNKELSYVIFSACGSFYLPTLIILVLYALVYRAAVKHSNFMESGIRMTRSQVTLRVHMGSTKLREETLCDTNRSMKLQNSTSPTSLLNPPPQNLEERRGSAGAWSIVSDHGRRLTATGIYGRAVKFRRQKKAAKTLGIVVGCFLLCWFPFFLILPLDAACASCQLSGTPFDLAFWLGYFNSCLNPFIYACSSKELRRAFLHLLCCRKKESLYMMRHRCSSSASAISIRRLNQQ